MACIPGAYGKVKPLFGRFRRVHFVGVGGIGMEGLARVLRAAGCRISGSDQVASRTVEQLREEGMQVHVGHRAHQVGDAELVVYSAAVPEDNEELEAARQKGIPIVSRAELLGELSRFYLTIGVAGSHGKTTTASMLAGILRRTGMEPGVLIGGWIDGRAQAALGGGKILVVEADEFDRSFLRLYPSMAVVTSVDAEHLDCYGDLQGVEEAFRQYLSRLPFYGQCVVAGDGRVGWRVWEGVDRPVFTYGLEKGNDFRAVEIEWTERGSRFLLERVGRPVGRVELAVPGEHNLRNALGAAGMALVMGADFDAVAEGLREFDGVERRFESKGEVAGVRVIDDYAHHPAELAEALATARRTGRRVIAVFQPHLYSRTCALCGRFASSLTAADRVILAEVYGARESALPGVGSAMIERAMRELGYDRVELVPEMDRIVERLLEICVPGDLVLVLGAGDIDRVAEALVERLGEREGG